MDQGELTDTRPPSHQIPCLDTGSTVERVSPADDAYPTRPN